MRRIILFFTLLVASAASAQVGVKTAIDSSDMLVGDKRAIRLSVSYSPGIRLLEPNIDIIDTSAALELLSASPWDTIQITDRVVIIEKDLHLTAWDSGYFLIPAIPVLYEIQGRIDTASSKEIPLRVRIVPPGEEELMPLKPLIEEPLLLQDFLVYLIGLAALLALAILFWQIRKRKKRALPAAAPPVEVIPPHIIALQKYDRLEAAQLWQKGNIKEYHTQLTYILREYLENHFHILALESTSHEITVQLERKIAEDLRQELNQLLHTSDLVKFAKAEPPAEVHERLLVQARRFIHANHPS